MTCFVLVNLHLFSLLCGAGIRVPSEGLQLSIIILDSWLVFQMLGCSHSLLRYSNISRFSQVECTFSYNVACVHLPVRGHHLVLLVLTFMYRGVLQGHLLFVDHFN